MKISSVIIFVLSVYGNAHSLNIKQSLYEESSNLSAETQANSNETIETGQSPIPLTFEDSQLTRVPNGITFENYELILENWFIHNNGYTAEVAPLQFVKGPQAPTIKGPGLPGRFVAQSFHFHWGSNDRQGSEHALDGSRYAMEVHIVHVNEKYSSLDEAKQMTDGIAVIGLLYFVAWIPFGSDPYKPVADQLPYIIEYNTTTPLLAHFRLSDITNRAYLGKYYSYSGSLTTPTFTENVSWIVIGLPIRVSENVLRQLRTLKGQDGNFLSNNYRELQPIGNRTVLDIITF